MENLPNRRSIRLSEYDYASAGYYFVTICVHNRDCLFGDIKDGRMHLNPFGKIVEEEWLRAPLVRNNIILGEYSVMPNHIHGIIIVTNGVGASRWLARNNDMITGPGSGAIGAIVGQFKPAVSRRVNKLRDTIGVPVWQRNYYEHIIRSDRELENTRKYIIDNPQRWDYDAENVDMIRASHRLAPTHNL